MENDVLPVCKLSQRKLDTAFIGDTKLMKNTNNSFYYYVKKMQTEAWQFHNLQSLHY